VNPYVQLDDEEKLFDDHLRQLYTDAQDVTPNQHARLMFLAKQTGLPTEVLKGHEDETFKSLQARDFDAKAWRRTYPELLKLYKKSPAFVKAYVTEKQVGILSRLWSAASRALQWDTDLMSAPYQSTQKEYTGLLTDEPIKAPAPPPLTGPHVDDELIAAYEGLGLKVPDEPYFPNLPKMPHIKSELADETGVTKPFKVFWEEFGQASKQMELAQTNYSLMLAHLQAADVDDIHRLERQAMDIRNQLTPHYYGEGAFSKVMKDAATLAGSSWTVVKEAGPMAVVFAGFGAMAGAAATKTPQGAAKGASLGARAGGLLGGLDATFQLEAGSMFGDLADVTTDDKEPVPLELRIGFSLMYGFAASGVEFGLLPLTLEKYGPLGEAIRTGTAKEFYRRMLTNPTTRGILRNVARAWRRSALGEAGEEATQQALQEGLTYLARSATAGEFQKPDVAGSMQAIADSFETTLIGGGVGGILPSGINATAQVIERNKSVRRTEQLQKTLKLYGESDILKAAPEEVAEVIRMRTAEEGAPVTHAYVDAQAFAMLFQNANVDPNEAAKEFFGQTGPEQLQAALVRGGKVEVPMAQYLRKFAPAPIGAKLLNDTALRPGEETPNQTAERREGIKTEVARIQKEYAADSKNVPAPITEAERAFVEEKARQLQASAPPGTYKTRDDIDMAILPFRRFIHTAAVRRGIPAEQLFAQERLQIVKGTGQAPQQGEMPQPAYHGTPHRGITEFQLNKIGTGEGAQVYGHGIYFTGTKKVAEHYRKQLSKTQGQVERDQWYIMPPDEVHPYRFYDKLTTEEQGDYFDILSGLHWYKKDMQPDEIMSRVRENLSKTVSAQQSWIDKYTREISERGGMDAEAAANLKFELGKSKDIQAAAQRKLALLDKYGMVAKPPLAAGQVYEAELPENDELLDYDKPLSEQPEKMKAVAREVFTARGYGDAAAVEDQLTRSTGRDLYEQLQFMLHTEARQRGEPGGMSPQAASEWLRGKGIPGLRYLDGNSRAQGEGTYNFVIWDESRMPITKTFYQDPKDNAPAHVTKVSRSALDAAEKDSRGYPTRAAMLAIAKPFQKGIFHNEDTGWDITLSRDGIDHSIQHPNPENALALSVLPKLIETAVWNPNPQKHKRNDRNILAVHVLNALMSIDGVQHVVALTVRETKDKKNLYHVEAIKIKSSVAMGKDASSLAAESRATPDSPSQFTVGQLRAFEKPKKKGPPKGNNSGNLHQRPEPSSTRVEAHRGFIQIIREAAGTLYRITLNPNADASTFLHETGHAFLDMMQRLSTGPDVPTDVKDDWQHILKYLGAEDGKLTTEHHEKWARSFEAYLREGNAPSPQLVRAFQRFRIWLHKIYRSIQALDVELSDGIRGVMDRMLATDEEIAATKTAMGLQPLFRSPEEAGMSPEQFQDYLAIAEQATSHATMAATHRVMKDRLRETERWWKQELAQHREEADAEYERLPAWRALQYVKKGIVYREDGSTLAEPTMGRLARDAVWDLLGKERARAFGNRLIKEGGEHPDDLASFIKGPDGLPVYATGKDVLEAMLALPERKAWVSERAEEAMRTAHPDILQERDRLREVVAKGLHGEYTLDWLQREWKALRARAGQEQGATPLESLKEAAYQIAERERVGGLAPHRALQAERAAANAAFEAVGKGDFAQAFVQKQKQLFHYYLHRALTVAKEDAEDFTQLAAKLSDEKARARAGLASPVYRDGIDRILEALGLKEPSPRDEPLASIRDVVQTLAENQETVAFDDILIARLVEERRPYKDLSVSDMREVGTALKNIRQAVRNRNEVLTTQEALQKDIVVNTLIQEAETYEVPHEPSKNELKRKYAEGLRPLLVLARLGGKNVTSMWHRAVIQPLRDAAAKRDDILRTTIKPIMDALDNVPSSIRARAFESIDGRKLFPNHVQTAAVPSRRLELYTLFLNAGNASNLEALLGGRNISPEQLTAALDTLEKAELDWLQTILDSIESLWPMVREQEEQDTGVPPPKIQATPIVTRHGTYRGGYFPRIYDFDAERIGAAQAENLLDVTYIRPSTSKSHTKRRVDGFQGVISLEMTNVYTHLAKVAHDLAFRRPLKSVYGVLNDDRVRAVLRERLGDEKAGLFRKWLVDVGHMDAANPNESSPAWANFLRARRTAVARAILGYAVDIAKGDLSNFAMAVAATPLKTSYAAQGILDFYTHPFQQRAFALERSGELRSRAHGPTHDFQLEIGKMRRRRHLPYINFLRTGIDAVNKHAFDVFEWVEIGVATPIWLGAYKQYLETNNSDDVEAAADFADDIVNKILPSKSVVDSPAILRSRSVTNLLLFHGFPNTKFNLEADILHDAYIAVAKQEGTKKKLKAAAPAVGIASARLIGLALAVSVLGEFFSGKGWDDDETVPEWIARKLKASPFYSLPWGAAFERILLKRAPSSRAAPGVAWLDKLMEAVGNANQDDAEWTDVAGKLIEAAGYYQGFPVVRGKRAGEYVWKVATGERNPDDPLDVLQGIIYGSRPDQPASPLRWDTSRKGK
jgi:hypothetical protein